MDKRSFRKNTSGQVLIVTALLVALLLLSTALYVLDTTKHVPTINHVDGSSFLGYKQAMRSTLISALANVTAGGSTGVLAADLAALKVALQANSYQAILNLDYTALSTGLYVNGFWVSWGSNGQGVSSAYVDFAINASSSTSTSDVQYPINVTSQVNLGGSYDQVNTTKVVDLTVKVGNDGKPALAQDLAFNYQSGSNWLPVVNPQIANFHNGTYSVTFTVESNGEIHSLPVSVLCLDQRGISVGANYTCTA